MEAKMPNQIVSAAPQEPFKRLVILTPHAFNEKAVLEGVFGEVKSIDENGGIVANLDVDLINSSSVFEPYRNAPLNTNLNEAVVIEVQSQAQLNSIKATLARFLSRKWSSRYESLIQGAGTLMRSALEQERAKALEGVSELIANTGVTPVNAKIAAITATIELYNEFAGETYTDSILSVIPIKAHELLEDSGEEVGRCLARELNSVNNLAGLNSGSCLINSGEMPFYLDLSDGDSQNELHDSVLALLCEHENLMRTIILESQTTFAASPVPIDVNRAIYLITEAAVNPVSDDNQLLVLLQSELNREQEQNLEPPAFTI